MEDDIIWFNLSDWKQLKANSTLSGRIDVHCIKAPKSNLEHSQGLIPLHPIGKERDLAAARRDRRNDYLSTWR